MGATEQIAVGMAINLSSVAHNQVILSNAAHQLSNVIIPHGFFVVIRALAGNAGVIYIGNSGLTSANGHEMSAKDIITLRVTNLDAIYALAATDTDKLSYIIETKQRIHVQT